MIGKKPVRHTGRTLSRLVEKACQQWELRKRAAAERDGLSPHTAQAFSIAVSREIGARGTAIAERIAQLLDWQVYDHELLEKIAHEMGLRTALLESVDERQQSWLWGSIEAFLSTPFRTEWTPLVSESAYFRHLVETIRALGVHGECVIVGRGAAFILPAETTLRVRFVGSVSERIAALSSDEGVTEREAAYRVRTTDRARNDFISDHFHKDPTDARNYDVVLNAMRLSLDHNAEIIVEALHRLQVQQRQGLEAKAAENRRCVVN